MTQYAFHFNSDVCTGCKTCQVACKETYKLPVNNLYRKVYNYQGGSWKPTEAGHYVPEGVFGYFVSLACNHCTNPACVANCPTGAMQKDEETGIVLVNAEDCIGCESCLTGCPYGVRQYNWGKPAQMAGLDDTVYAYGYPREYRDDGHLVYAPERPEGVMEKCTFCAQLTSQGLDPACCTACPGNARIFGDMDDADSAIRTYLDGADREPFTLGDEYHTKPNVFYLASHEVSQVNPLEDAADEKGA